MLENLPQQPHPAGNDTTVVSLPAIFDIKNKTKNAQIPIELAFDTNVEESGICVHHY